MQRSVTFLSLALAGALTLSACTTTQGGGYTPVTQGPKQGIGTLAGAIAGGALGSRFGQGSGKTAATVAGALIGGYLGNQLGANLDTQDRQNALNAEYRALEYAPTGSAVTWRGPNTGNYGEVVAGDLQNNCRDYTHTVYIDGQAQVAKGRACRNTDGTWRVVG